MKNAIIICLVLTLFSTSCGRNEDKEIETNSVDSSLYISYTVRGNHFKQIQDTAPIQPNNIINYLEFNEKIIWSYRNSFMFGNLSDRYHPNVILSFWDTLLTPIYDYTHYPDFSIRIKEKYKFTAPNFYIENFEREISDTVFMVGTSISLLDSDFSTQYLLKHYNFDPNIFLSSIFKNSFLKIDSSKSHLNGQIIISGTFSTVIMNLPLNLNQPDTLSINGNFNLVTK